MESPAGREMKPLKLVYIVRRYGPVGGMERYVWELTKELAAMGHQVTVLCEKLATVAAPKGIELVQLGPIHRRPRWLAHLRFSRKVSAWVANNPDPKRIIHSHERTAVHDVTTFHGPPFAIVKRKPLWQRCSPRIFANLWLEKRELCGPQVKAVIPNSPLIADALKQYYPNIESHLTPAIAPGVGEIHPRAAHTVTSDGGNIGFIGKEWKRKGLDLAVKIVAELKKQRPQVKFIVAGPHPDEICHLFKDWNGGFQLLGEIDSTSFYAQLDLLLHPARQEPYGMVIAEARAAGVPVLVSDNCGITSELNENSILRLDSGINIWRKRCDELIGQHVESVVRNWRTVAEEQVLCYRNFRIL
jgi:UDP-glucose:(heptosyl)LPS alpha-1,3-glucosyltransferase